MSNNPQLLFVAGPNGAGKSTFSKDLSIPGAIIFDVDKVVAQIEAQSPHMPKRRIYEEATKDFFKQVNAAVKDRRHFTLETNFRDESLMDVVAHFKAHGYATHLIYLTLESIEQSVFRVNERVKDGGHFVDIKNIQQNYDLGLEYIERFADHFDNVEIADASKSNQHLRSLLSIQNRSLVYQSSNIPEKFVNRINAIVEKFIPPSPTQELRPYRGPSR